MKNDINKILEDLYESDPSLKNRQAELIKIINYLIIAKPEIVFKAENKSKLRAQLLAKLAETSLPFWHKYFKALWSQKIILAYSTIALAVILILPALYLLPTGDKTTPSPLIGGQKISFVGNNSFGKLADTGKKDVAESSLGFGRGGGGAAATDAGKMIAYPGEITDYVYKYVGEPLSLSGDLIKAYKREISGSWLAGTGKLVGRLNVDAANLSALKNPQIHNLMVKEDIDGGYEVAIGLKDENITINRSLVFRNSAAPEEPLKIDQVPTDDELIRIADNFLKKFSLAKDNYGAPEVDRNWQIVYASSLKSGTEPAYVPPQINVIYPLLVDGRQVYEEGGSKTGLMVMIDIREKTVLGAYNIASQNYLSSNYSPATDAEKVMKVVNNGGFYNYHPENAAKKVTLELGTPHIELIRIWRYYNDQSEEIYVPALIFDIKNAPTDDYFYSRYVTIPLVKDIFEERWNQSNFGLPSADNSEPMPVPTPLRTPAAEIQKAGANEANAN